MDLVVKSVSFSCCAFGMPSPGSYIVDEADAKRSTLPYIGLESLVSVGDSCSTRYCGGAIADDCGFDCISMVDADPKAPMSTCRFCKAGVMN